MDFVQTLRSIIELLSELALWPRDIVKYLMTALAPWLVHARFKSEWAKPRDERFRDELAPTLYWMLAVVSSYFCLFDHYLSAIADQFPAVAKLSEQPLILRLFVVAFILSAWPLSGAMVIQSRLDKSRRDRDTLLRLFATNCVTLAPASLVLLTSLLLGASFHEKAKIANTYLLYVFFGLSLYAHVSVVLTELGPGLFRKIDVISSCVGRTLLHALGIMLLGGALIVLGGGQSAPMAVLLTAIGR